MNSFVGEEFGRIVVLSFQMGDKLLEGIRSECERLGIENAVLVSAIGTFDKARFHRITTTEEEPTDEIITVEDPIELSAMDGMVIEGEPHFHMVFSDLDKTYSGHLEDGSTILYLGEVVLAEIKDMDIQRSEDGRKIIKKDEA